MYLKKAGELRPLDVAYAAGALVLLLVPAVGSVYPVPSPPVNVFPYIFATYILIGLAIFEARRMAGKMGEEDYAPEAVADEPALAS
jgi:hypothetical protein